MNPRSRIVNRRALKRLAIFAIVLAIILAWGYFSMIRMPRRSFRGDLTALAPQQSTLAKEIRRYIEMLAGTIGPRNIYHSSGLNEAVAYLQESPDSFT